MTCSEIIKAENIGAKMIKLFPGNILGPKFMSSIKVLFPDIMFMTHVSLENKKRSNRFKLGLSKQVISKPILEKKNYCKIEKPKKKFLDILNSIPFKYSKARVKILYQIYL